MSPCQTLSFMFCNTTASALKVEKHWVFVLLHFETNLLKPSVQCRQVCVLLGSSPNPFHFGWQKVNLFGFALWFRRQDLSCFTYWGYTVSPYTLLTYCIPRDILLTYCISPDTPLTCCESPDTSLTCCVPLIPPSPLYSLTPSHLLCTPWHPLTFVPHDTPHPTCCVPLHPSHLLCTPWYPNHLCIPSHPHQLACI